MKLNLKKSCVPIMALLVFSSVFSQREADKTLSFDSSIKDLYFHNTTGIPIVVTGGGVYGLNKKTGDRLWSFKESSLVSSLDALGQDVTNSYSEIPFSPYAIFNQSVFNVTNGKQLLIPTRENYKKVVDFKYVASKKSLLIITRKEDSKKAKAFLIDFNNDNILWDKEFQVDKKISKSGVSNFIENNKVLSFTLSKNILILNSNDGKVVLNEKYDSGRLFFSQNNDAIIAVENESSSLVGTALKASFTMGLSLIGNKPIGKEIKSFSIEDGTKLWKKPIKLDEGFVSYQYEDGKLFIIHKDGARFYNDRTGEELWKKDIKENKIKGIEKKPEGYMVYFKSKKLLVDNSGRKIWKKPKSLNEDLDFELEDDEDYAVFNYENGKLFLTPFRVEYFKNGEKKRIYKISLSDTDKLLHDDDNNNLIIVSNKKLYVLNPDRGLGKDQVSKIDFHNYRDIEKVEPREKGYFINGSWEYVITDFNGKEIKKKYFPQPGEGLRHLKNVGAGMLALGGAAYQVSGIMNAGVGASLMGPSALVGNQAAYNQGNNYFSKGENQYATGLVAEDISNALTDFTRYNAFKEVKDDAFFYTKDNDQKVLLRVNKDTGEVVEKYVFGVNNPKYEIDEVEKHIYHYKGKDLMIFNF